MFLSTTYNDDDLSNCGLTNGVVFVYLLKPRLLLLLELGKAHVQSLHLDLLLLLLPLTQELHQQGQSCLLQPNKTQVKQKSVCMCLCIAEVQIQTIIQKEMF